MAEKTCRACGETKAADEFGKHARTSDGLHTTCRECVGAKQRAGKKRGGEPRAAKPKKAREGTGHVVRNDADLATCPEPTGETREGVLVAALRCIATGEAVENGRVVRRELGPTGMREVAARALAAVEAMPAAAPVRAKRQTNGNGKHEDVAAPLWERIAGLERDRAALVRTVRLLTDENGQADDTRAMLRVGSLLAEAQP
jgi:hypothetical protein